MKNQQNIQCEWMSKNNALVNIDGQVYPCCYLANSFTLRIMFGPADDIPVFLADEYVKNKDSLNLENRSLRNILNSEWFTKTLPASWEDENLTHRLCKKYCSVNSEYYHPNKSRPRNKDETTE